MENSKLLIALLVIALVVAAFWRERQSSKSIESPEVDQASAVKTPKYSPKRSDRKIAILMALGKWSVVYSWMYPMSFYNHKHYADRHGYDFIVTNRSLSVPRRSGYWSKLSAVMAVLPHYDWIFYTDVDTVITNYDVKLENHVLDDAYSAVITSDSRSLNSGVWAMKNSKVAFEFLRDIFRVPEAYWRNETEQTAWIRAIRHKRKYEQMQLVVPQKRMNSYEKNMWPGDPPESHWTQGDFLLHCCGCFWLKYCRRMFTKHFLATQQKYLPESEHLDIRRGADVEPPKWLLPPRLQGKPFPQFDAIEPLSVERWIQETD